MPAKSDIFFKYIFKKTKINNDIDKVLLEIVERLKKLFKNADLNKKTYNKSDLKLEIKTHLFEIDPVLRMLKKIKSNIIYGIVDELIYRRVVIPTTDDKLKELNEYIYELFYYFQFSELDLLETIFEIAYNRLDKLSGRKITEKDKILYNEILVIQKELINKYGSGTQKASMTASVREYYQRKGKLVKAFENNIKKISNNIIKLQSRGKLSKNK